LFNKGGPDQVSGNRRVEAIPGRGRLRLTATERRARAIRKIVMGTWPELDLEAPMHTYAVDAVNLPAIRAAHSCNADATIAVRRLVNAGSRYALSLARQALIDYPVKRPRVERAYKALHEIRQLIRELHQVTPFDMANCGAAWGSFELLQQRFRPAELRFKELFAALETSQELLISTLAEFPLLPPPKTANVDFLAHGVLLSAGKEWQRITGTAPRLSASGPFIRLVAAAWVDLHLPTEDQNGNDQGQDLIGWLGEKWVKFKPTMWKPSK
jgi:hypothetical protein